MKSNDVVKALAALAHDSRLAVFRLLIRRGPEGFTPGQIGEQLDIPAPTLSFHLKTLSGAGLIVARREGRHLHYSPDLERMNQTLAFLTEHCCSLATDCAPGTCQPTRTTRRRTA